MTTPARIPKFDPKLPSIQGAMPVTTPADDDDDTWCDVCMECHAEPACTEPPAKAPTPDRPPPLDAARMFPLQTQRDVPPGPVSIPWSVAEKAYGAYAAQYGRSQSLERLAQRGGFGWGEMDTLYPPWRQEVDELVRLRADLAAARAKADAGEKFKSFCHSYLDQHGVPHGDPMNQHQIDGCRIGARLDLLFAERDAARALAAELAQGGQNLANEIVAYMVLNSDQGIDQRVSKSLDAWSALLARPDAATLLKETT